MHNCDELYHWVKDYIDRKCIERGVMPGKIQGTTYAWMFYLRRGLFNQEFLSATSQLFFYKIKKEIGHFNFQIAGLETGSTPLLVGIPLIGRVFNLDINAFSVRKEPKKYGLQNWIEGIPNDNPVLLVDDLCNSSASMRQCYDICMRQGIPVLDHAFCIVNKVNKSIHTEARVQTDMYLPSNIKMHYLFDLDDFNLENPSH